MISFRSHAKFDQAVGLVLLTEEHVTKSAVGDFQWKSLEDEIKGLSQNKQFLGKNDELFPLSVGKQMVLLVGLGSQKELTQTSLRVTVRKALLSNFAKKFLVPFKSYNHISKQNKKNHPRYSRA